MLQRLMISLILLSTIFCGSSIHAAEDLSVDSRNANSFNVTLQNDNQSETALSVELTDYSLEQFDFEGESYTVADF
ncbi:MAG: hypothetical protein HQ568_10830, partial [Calditrichaeota bacterium]|nr:hypothetical protein [Calditrichota bacterium]